jgi:hypothetical protein
MMPAMSKPRTGWVRGHVCLSTVLVLAACGGETKQADSPGTCPEGTVLRGSDCVPPEAEKDKAAAQDRAIESTPPPSPAPVSADTPTASAPGPAASPQASSGPVPYDKDSVEVELKRGSRQVKANCGAATDDDGHATGPWGKTKASITLGRNGHIKQVTVPAPYDGKPVGLCIAHSFDKIQFPPYAGDTDAVVDWDVELVRPKGH